MASSIGEIAVRSMTSLFVGIFLVAAVSAYTAHPSRTAGVSFWIALPVIAGKICLAVGSVGIGVVLSKQTGGGIQSVVALIIGGVGTLWCCSIVVQFTQNLGYRIVGARVQAIQWLNNKKRPSRDSRNRGSER